MYVGRWSERFKKSQPESHAEKDITLHVEYN